MNATRISLARTAAAVVTLLCGALWLPPAEANEPAFPAGAPWFNVSRPLTADDLSGRVVLLDFFTPGCINCIHVLPETARLESEFGSRLLIIGVNSPKFTASQESANIAGFIERYDIHHPIVTDKGMVLWNRYGVFAWPTQILFGPDGSEIGRYIGEGKYEKIRADVLRATAAAAKAGTLNTRPLPMTVATHGGSGLLQPGKVTVGSELVAVSDTGHNRVMLFDRKGRVVRVIGNGRAGYRDGSAAEAEFSGPQGVAFHGEALYVADTSNQRIRRIGLRDGRVSTVAGNGRQEYGVVGEQAALEAGLNSPWDLLWVNDTLYVAMAGDHQIWRLGADGRIGPYAGSGAEGLKDGPREQASFAQSSGLAYHDSQLYVADPESSAVRVMNLASGAVHTLVGAGLFTFGMRDGQASAALLQHDQGLAWLAGRLYIADTFNNAIRVLNLKTQQVGTLATGLAQPGGIAVLDERTLLVTDTNANRMVTVDTTSGAIADWSDGK